MIFKNETIFFFNGLLNYVLTGLQEGLDCYVTAMNHKILAIYFFSPKKFASFRDGYLSSDSD